MAQQEEDYEVISVFCVIKYHGEKYTVKCVDKKVVLIERISVSESFYVKGEFKTITDDKDYTRMQQILPELIDRWMKK